MSDGGSVIARRSQSCQKGVSAAVSRLSSGIDCEMIVPANKA